MFSAAILLLSCMVLVSPSQGLVLRCNDTTSSCPGTVTNCQCLGAVASLTWTISSPSGDSEVIYTAFDGPRVGMVSTPFAGYDASVVLDAIYLVMTEQFKLLNSSLNVTAQAESLMVTCQDTQKNLSVTLQIADPSAPTNLDVSGSIANESTTLKLEWGPPLKDGGANVTSYEIFINASREVEQESSSMMANVELNSTGEYLVEVRAVNCVGHGPSISRIIIVTDKEVILPTTAVARGTTTTDLQLLSTTNASTENTITSSTTDDVTDEDTMVVTTSATHDLVVTLKVWQIAIIIVAVGGVTAVIVLPIVICKYRAGKSKTHQVDSHRPDNDNQLDHLDRANRSRRTQPSPVVDGPSNFTASDNVYSVVELQHMDINNVVEEEDPNYSTVHTATESQVSRTVPSMNYSKLAPAHEETPSMYSTLGENDSTVTAKSAVASSNYSNVEAIPRDEEAPPMYSSLGEKKHPIDKDKYLNLNLDRLIRMLRRVESRWADIAGHSAFNLPADLIQDLRALTCSDTDYQCLIEVCEAWIKKDRRSPPTWKEAAEAIRNIGCVEIANEMMSIYSQGRLPPHIFPTDNKSPSESVLIGDQAAANVPSPAAGGSYDYVLVKKDPPLSKPLVSALDSAVPGSQYDEVMHEMKSDSSAPSLSPHRDVIVRNAAVTSTESQDYSTPPPIPSQLFDFSDGANLI